MQTIRHGLTLILLLCATLSVAQSTVESASEAYRSEDYKRSIQLYEQVVAQLLSEGRESAEIYYNLGNAYFRNGETAKAILNYERALLLDPGDSDIRHNLRFARTRIEDKIDTAETFFLTSWINNLENLLNSNRWATLAIILFIADLPRLGWKRVAVIAPGFPVDNLETLFDIDIQAREIFMKAGGEKFVFVPSLNYSDDWIEAIWKITLGV
jgi:tetratricopeptide (TPR) repeat protein